MPAFPPGERLGAVDAVIVLVGAIVVGNVAALVIYTLVPVVDEARVVEIGEEVEADIEFPEVEVAI